MDWLVVMRRSTRAKPSNTLQAHSLEAWQLDRLVAALVQFYRRAAPVPICRAASFRVAEESRVQPQRSARPALPPAGGLIINSMAYNAVSWTRRDLLAGRVRAD